MSPLGIVEAIAGLALVVWGVADMHPPSAFIVAGASLCGLSLWTERRR